MLSLFYFMIVAKKSYGHTVLGLDLSKVQTGYSVLRTEVPYSVAWASDKGQYDDLFYSGKLNPSIKLEKLGDFGLNDKRYAGNNGAACRFIRTYIEKLLDTLDLSEVLIVYEARAYNAKTNSPIQTLLTETLLDLCREYNLNAVGVSPISVKKGLLDFVRAVSPNIKLPNPTLLSKTEMLDLAKEYMPGAYINHNQLDALLIAWVGTALTLDTLVNSNDSGMDSPLKPIDNPELDKKGPDFCKNVYNDYFINPWDYDFGDPVINRFMRIRREFEKKKVIEMYRKMSNGSKITFPPLTLGHPHFHIYNHLFACSKAYRGLAQEFGVEFASEVRRNRFGYKDSGYWPDVSISDIQRLSWTPKGLIFYDIIP